ncbi:MAG: hypothetical protein R3F37_03995 [Candidatus Competibacteraceae bacterium]
MYGEAIEYGRVCYAAKPETNRSGSRQDHGDLHHTNVIWNLAAIGDDAPAQLLGALQVAFNIVP